MQGPCESGGIGGGGVGGGARGTVGKKRTKEGKFGTRGTGKRRVLQKNGEVAETNMQDTSETGSTDWAASE